MRTSGRLTQLRHDPRIVFAVLGTASGVAGAVVYGWVGDPTGLKFPGVLWEVVIGVVFGAVMGAALLWRDPATARTATLFAVLATLSWLAAHRLGIQVGNTLGMPAIGVLSGLVGAGGVATTLAWLFPLYRDRRAWLTVAGTGAVFGVLLAGPSAFTLFPPWQAAVALAIAWPLRR